MTVESHDGEHKYRGKTPQEVADLECEGVPHFPMVVVEIQEPERLVAETERLYGHVEAIVGEVFPWIDDGGNPDMAIRAEYDPVDKRALIRISQLSDDWFDPYDKMEDPS